VLGRRALSAERPKHYVAHLIVPAITSAGQCDTVADSLAMTQSFIRQPRCSSLQCKFALCHKMLLMSMWS